MWQESLFVHAKKLRVRHLLLCATPVLEIEGSSEASVREAIKLLDLEKNRTWVKGERILIQDIYKLNWYEMRF